MNWRSHAANYLTKRFYFYLPNVSTLNSTVLRQPLNRWENLLKYWSAIQGSLYCSEWDFPVTYDLRAIDVTHCLDDTVALLDIVLKELLCFSVLTCFYSGCDTFIVTKLYAINQWENVYLCGVLIVAGEVGFLSMIPTFVSFLQQPIQRDNIILLPIVNLKIFIQYRLGLGMPLR